jgi:hypothetical protein
MNRMASLLIVLIDFAAISPAESFDVVSIREIPQPGERKSGEITYRGGNLYMNGVTLGYAVQWASTFKITNWKIRSGFTGEQRTISPASTSSPRRTRGYRGQLRDSWCSGCWHNDSAWSFK